MRVSTKLTLKSSQNIVYVWKVSGQSGKFPDSLESFRTVWKVSGLSGKFPDFWKLKHLNKYVAKAIYALLVNVAKTIYALFDVFVVKKRFTKVFGQFGKFPDTLESFRTVWNVSRESGKFLDSLESFRTVWKVSGQSGK